MEAPRGHRVGRTTADLDLPGVVPQARGREHTLGGDGAELEHADGELEFYRAAREDHKVVA